MARRKQRAGLPFVRMSAKYLLQEEPLLSSSPACCQMPRQGKQRAGTLKSGRWTHPSSGPATGLSTSEPLDPLPVCPCVRWGDNEVNHTGQSHVITSKMALLCLGEVVETMQPAAVTTAQGHQASWC